MVSDRLFPPSTPAPQPCIKNLNPLWDAESKGDTGILSVIFPSKFGQLLSVNP
jgi:hypothetical protein